MIAVTVTATVTVRRNRPTRTADLGNHPETGKRWTRILRSGSTFDVGALELARLEAWRKANPTAAQDLIVRPLATGPSPALVRLRRVLALEGAGALPMAELLAQADAAGLEVPEAVRKLRKRDDLVSALRALVG